MRYSEGHELHTFRQALRIREFTLTAELVLDSHSDSASLIGQAKILAEQVDAIQVPENSGNQVHMSPLAAAAILLGAGIDPVLHMNCRDRNSLALRGDLLGAASLGVSSLLLMRGKEFSAAARPRIQPVYEWGARRLIACASKMQGAEFLLGSIATVFKPDRNWQPEKIVTKADAGARFIQTQLCFDIDVLRHYMARLVEEKLIERVNVIVALGTLPSADIAHWLGKSLRGAAVPARLVKRLRQASDPEQEGIKICAELLQAVAEIPGTSGAHLTGFGNQEAVAEAVRQSGVRG